MPYQLEALILHIPQGVKKTGTYQQVVARETECERILFQKSPLFRQSASQLALSGGIRVSQLKMWMSTYL
jgi:hypothetical protein